MFAAAKLLQRAEDPIEQLCRRFGAMDLQEGFDPVDTEEIAPLAASFGDAVGIEKEWIARRNGNFVDVTSLGKLREQTDESVLRIKPRAATFDRAVQKRGRVPASRVVDHAPRPVDFQAEERYVQIEVAEAPKHEAVETIDDLARMLNGGQSAADKAVDAARQEGRGQSVARDVADALEDSAWHALINRRIVTPEHLCLLVARVDLHPIVGQSLRQQATVHQASEVQIAFGEIRPSHGLGNTDQRVHLPAQKMRRAVGVVGDLFGCRRRGVRRP